jgi:hypothetical protein
MDITSTDEIKSKSRPTSMPTQPQQQELIEQLMMGLYDSCSRIDVTVSTVLNAITSLNNTKNDHLKLLGRLREQSMGNSISSK